jgi:hypothetical protein
MQHLSRRFSANVFLYVVIASFVWLIVFNLAATFGIGFYFFQEHATLIVLFFRLMIFVPPIAAVAVYRQPVKHALRIHAFTIRQFWFTLGIAVCAYFALSGLSALLDKLNSVLMYPYTADFIGSYFSGGGFSFWPYLFTNCLIPAILAGVVYCGAILSGLHQMRPLKACLTIGLLYALVQFRLVSFIPSALLGFVLCYITLRSNSIFPAIIAGFLYLVMDKYGVTSWLNFLVFSPVGVSQHIIAIFLAVIFILLGGWMLVKMPDRKYEKGAAKRALQRLRGVFPGLFSVSMLDRPEQKEMLAVAPETAKTASEPVSPVAADKSADTATADIPDTELDVRENNPMIAGIFISATVTVVLFGISIMASLGYFGG